MTTPDVGTVFRTLAGALQTGALLLDDQGSVVEVNEPFADLVGRPPARCVGAVAPHPWWQGPDLGALVQAVASGAAASARAHGRILTPDGVVDVDVDVRGFETDEGVAPRGAIAVVRNRSSDRRLDLGFIARHVGDVISVHDPDGRIAFMSDASRTLYGVPPERLIGRLPFDLLVPDDRPLLRETLERLRSGAGTDESVSFRVRRPDGRELAVDANAHAVRDPDGTLSSITCVARDATSRIVAERAAARDAARRSQLRAAEQAALRRVALAAATETHPSAVLGTIAREVARLLDVEAALVCMLDGPGFSVVGLHGTVEGVLLGDWIASASVPALSWIAEEQGPVPATTQTPPRGLVGATMLAAPVDADDRRWGAVVALAPSGTRVPSSAEPRLARFCEVVGVAVGAADARRRLASQAETDPLTGLANHRAFQERLRGEVARAQRHGRTLSLALLDLDHFKNLNDWYGHQEGDRALVEVAHRLREAARSGDLIARVGGEEFAWLLPETDGVRALEAVHRARELVGDSPLQGGQDITVSGGVCDLAWATGADELYRLADGALYWAKANGRNQVCLYSPDVVEPMSAEERADWLARSNQLAALRALVHAVDARIPGAWPHAERVAALAGDLALTLGWPVDAANAVREAGLLHDVGKIAASGEPDAPDGHAAIGAEIARDALSDEQCDWIRRHHEHADAGTDDDLAGDHLPTGASILAVAEAWDEMVEGSPALAPEAVLEAFRAESGRRFAPEVVDALVRLQRGPSFEASEVG